MPTPAWPWWGTRRTASTRSPARDSTWGCVTWRRSQQLVSASVAAGGDPGSPELLRRFQALRRPANLAMLAGTDLLDRLFSSDLSTLRLARDFGIAAVNRIGPLKRVFVRAAMGG